jgi:hypothetical protein
MSLQNERSCKGCFVCCSAIPITDPKIGKGWNEPCKHLDSDGCGIYDERPEGCRVFSCLWKMGQTPLDRRPEESGIMLIPGTGVEDFQSPVFIAHEIWEGAATEEDNAEWLGALKKFAVVVVAPTYDEKARKKSTILARKGIQEQFTAFARGRKIG